MKLKNDNNMFYYEDEQGIVSKMTYSIDNDIMTINYTFTREDKRGQGLAKSLLNGVIKYCKENNLEIVSTCSFVKKELT